MGIFTRFRDIVSSNINAMLDRAEDPEKMIKLMIREMEDTLIELKASCAGVMANRSRTQRQLNECQSRCSYWEDRAKIAVNKGRDDLAREALGEKRRYTESAAALDREIGYLGSLIEQYQADIRQLEDRLRSAREKQRILVQRHIHAYRKRRAQEEIRRMDSVEAVTRFEEIENRIERMEAEADLMNYGIKTGLEENLDNLVVDEEIEKELQNMKASIGKEDKRVSE